MPPSEKPTTLGKGSGRNGPVFLRGNMKNQVEERLSDSNLKDIQDFLMSKLAKKKAVKRLEVFEALGSNNSELSKAHFCESLSKNIKSGRLPGLKIVRGPHGGISLDEISRLTQKLEEQAESSPEEEVEAEPEVEPEQEVHSPVDNLLDQEVAAPVTKKKELPLSPPASTPFTNRSIWRWIWINDSRYSVFMGLENIEKFLVKVMQAKEDPEGSVVFHGKRYSVCDEKLLHRFLADFIGAGVTISEPLEETTDANGSPLQLVSDVNDSPSPEALKEWNEKQKQEQNENHG